MKLKWYHAIVLLAVGAIALAACTGDAEPRSESTSTQQAAEEQSTPPEGDVFRRTFQDPPTLDPHHASDTLSSAIIVELFSGLVTINLDLQLAPDLAESWEVSSDGLTYTFRLRPNAVFHDGKPVTAHDVKYSFERALDPETGSATVDTYLDDIVGAEARLAGQAQEVEGVRVVDDRTLTITIEEPRAYFLAKLTYPTAFVVDRENIEEHGDQWTQEPNGTGPFRLKEYRIGELMVLERNPDFYLEPAKVEQVELILSGGSSMAMYENDEIHITGVGLESLERVTNPSDPLNQDLVVAAPSFNITYIGFNVNEPPFDDLNVRQALSMVINKDLIAEEVLVGLVAPAEGILPPGFPGTPGASRAWSSTRSGPSSSWPSRGTQDSSRASSSPSPAPAARWGWTWRSSVGCGRMSWRLPWRSSRWSGPPTSTTCTPASSRPSPAWGGRPTTRTPRTSWTSSSTRRASSTAPATTTPRWTVGWRMLGRRDGRSGWSSTARWSRPSWTTPPGCPLVQRGAAGAGEALRQGLPPHAHDPAQAPLRLHRAVTLSHLPGGEADAKRRVTANNPRLHLGEDR